MKFSKMNGFLIFSFFLLADIFSQDDIIIQADYWTGTKCLENGVPWQVPGSIFKEDEHCRDEDVVLELGSGGSTIFFAKRCKNVISIETDPSWAAVVSNRLNELDIKNVTLLCMPKAEEIKSFLRNLDVEYINIFSVDTVHGYNRSAFVHEFLSHGVSDQLHMIVMDNYGDSSLFPSHYTSEIIYSNEWETYTYDDLKWCGNGTKLYIRKS